MSSYVLTPLAKSDIFEIWRMIAADSEQAADRVERAIYETCAFVAESPMRGHTQPEAVGLPFDTGRLRAFATIPSSTNPSRRHSKSSPSCRAREITGGF